jgi:hypothetical protein
MKTTILVLFSFLVITVSLSGQTIRSKYHIADIKPDTIFSTPQSDNRQINNYLNINKKDDLFAGKKSDQKFDLNQNRFHQYPIKIRRYPESETEEKFPGSSRFYGNVFHITPDTTGNLFFKKPDTSRKYYLVILDPIHHTIIR